MALHHTNYRSQSTAYSVLHYTVGTRLQKAAQRTVSADDMSHTASKTWISDETREFEAWVKIRDSMSRISPKSPFVPKTFKEWLAYQVSKREEERQRIVRKIISKQANPKRKGRVVNPAMGGRLFDDQLALVLAKDTIWRPLQDRGRGRPRAPWPTHDEFKHEGDDRNKSGYSRFPPLPREPGNETVNWKQRKPLKQTEFDEVGRPAVGSDEEKTGHLDGSALELLGVSLQDISRA